MKFIFFRGRNTNNIINDAKLQFASKQFSAIIICRENDRLAEAGDITPKKFSPSIGKKYGVIANGGTTSQLVPVLKKLVESGVEFEVYDLQPDEMERLW